MIFQKQITGTTKECLSCGIVLGLTLCLYKMSGSDLLTWVVQHGRVGACIIGPCSVWEIFIKLDGHKMMKTNY